MASRVSLHITATGPSAFKQCCLTCDPGCVTLTHAGWEPPCPPRLLLQSKRKPWWPPRLRAAPCTKSRSLPKVTAPSRPAGSRDTGLFRYKQTALSPVASPPSGCPMHQSKPAPGEIVLTSATSDGHMTLRKLTHFVSCSVATVRVSHASVRACAR